ncbi:MAG: EAL domain-containing protein, partial [Candidatus Nanopelagicales bacterium]|nr:EAL domain-containing protein [Candidatus Nanopelagicales bacterium]
VVNAANDGFIVTDHAGEVIWASHLAGRFFGVDSERLRGQMFGIPREVAGTVSEIEILAPDGAVGSGRMEVTPTIWDGVAGFLITIQDISASTRVRQRLAHVAGHDELTGLPSRKLFDLRLRQANERALRFGGGLSVIMVVIDRASVTTVSADFGEEEKLIAHTADRLSNCMRANDALFRIDHLAFACINEDVPGLEQAKLIAGRIAAGFESPLVFGSREVSIAVGLGVVHSFGADGPSVDLLRNARAAVPQPRVPARVSIGTCSDESAATAKQQLVLAEQFPAAIRNGELRLMYQPIISAKSGKLEAVEALIRWDRGRLGILPPARFLPIVEQIGLMSKLDRWVIATACEQARCWSEQAGPSAPMVHVNITVQDLMETDFVAFVEQVLMRTSVDPALICIELIETEHVENMARAVETVAKLRDLGCGFAIDDFGSGFSSYSYMDRFVVGKIKIDRSFIAGLGVNYKDGVIVSSMIALARGLGALSVGEGVETELQATKLRELGCDQLQGYLFAKPTTAEEITESLGNSW